MIIGVVSAAAGGVAGISGLFATVPVDGEESALPETEELPHAGVRGGLVLRPPSRKLPLPPVTRAPSTSKAEGWAFAFHYRSEIYKAMASKLEVAGYVRRGTHLKVGARTYGPGCKGGQWYPVAEGGYICTRRGFVVASTKEKARIAPPIRQRPATVSRVLPYRYAKVKQERAPRLFRLPTRAEEKLIASAAAGKAAWPEVVHKAMKGIYFVGLDRIEGKSKRYYRTIRGRYVLKDHLEPRKTPRMRGELLGKQDRLPLAFVFGEDSVMYRLQAGRLVKHGKALKHARFPVERTFKRGDAEYVEGPAGLVLPRDSVRIVRRIARPERIPPGKRWIHVDLSEQSLVAYDDETPVFATLVSSGKKGFEPPIGVFRIVSKHVSITMDGPDPDEGWYEVGDVPWTMYYWESFALHGAYWHDDFGKTRSHGCTNIAPADARWLFHWTEPALEHGWHGKLGNGTHVTFTG